jgi:hypothetical protein
MPGGGSGWCLLICFRAVAFSAENLKVARDRQAAIAQGLDVINGEVICSAALAAPRLLFSKCFADLAPGVVVSSLVASGACLLFDSIVNAFAFVASSCACDLSAIQARSR